MKDKLIEHRSKSKFVIEIRHEALLDIFDRKGELIKRLHPALKPELQHWRIQNNEVSFLDSLEDPLEVAFADLKKFGMRSESSKSIVKFKNNFKKFLYPAYENFYKKIGVAQRIGFRLLSLLNKTNEEDFETINSAILEKFLKKIPISANPTDCRIHISIDNGYYLVGPISKDKPEVWIDSYFSDKTVTQSSYGVDIDAFISDVDVSSLDKFENAVLSVMDLAISIEEQLAISLEIINK